MIYDFGWHGDGAAYIVMEHLTGESMQARLRNGRLPAPEAVRLVQQTAMAMAVAHAAGIIHRDLKPDNLFLVRDPVVAGGERIKILDFGIAKLLGDDHGNPARTRSGMIMGTPTYMSPEQCRGAGDIDHRTDIYALGCVLFHLLCGRLPFLARTPGDMIAAHLLETPPLPSMFAPHVSIELDEITTRCLAKRADDRYASMTELARALAGAGGALGEIASIPPVRAATRDSRPALRPGTEPPVVARSAQTVGDTGSPGSAYPRGPQPSTFSRGAGESMSEVQRGGRWAAAAVAVLALGAIAVAIVVTVTRSPGPPGPPASGSAPGAARPDAAAGVAATPAALVDAAVDASPDAAPVDAARADAARPDAGRPVRPPSDAAAPRPRSLDAGFDPYANP